MPFSNNQNKHDFRLCFMCWGEMLETSEYTISVAVNIEVTATWLFINLKLMHTFQCRIAVYIS